MTDLKELFPTMNAAVGQAVLASQLFESSLTMVGRLVLDPKRSKATLAELKADPLTANNFRPPVTQLLNDLNQKNAGFERAFEKSVRELVEDRHWLVHRSIFGNKPFDREMVDRITAKAVAIAEKANVLTKELLGTLAPNVIKRLQDAGDNEAAEDLLKTLTEFAV